MKKRHIALQGIATKKWEQNDRADCVRLLLSLFSLNFKKMPDAVRDVSDFSKISKGKRRVESETCKVLNRRRFREFEDAPFAAYLIASILEWEFLKFDVTIRVIPALSQ